MTELAYASAAIPIRDARAAATRSAVALSLAALLLPPLLATFPPLVDYPNHLARLWLLAGGASNPALTPFYRIQWDTWTNIGIDGVGTALVHVLPLQDAGRLLVAAAALLAPLGGALLWRQVHGRWHWWQISFSLLAWNMGLVFGFLNFTLGLGLALLFAAADPALTRALHRLPAGQTIARMACALLLLPVHLFALPLYGALPGGLALGPRVSDMLRPNRRLPLLRELAGIALALAVPLLILMQLAPSPPGTGVGASAQSLLSDVLRGLANTAHDPLHKGHELLAGVLAYDWRLDLSTALVMTLPIAAALLCRRLVVHAGLLIAGSALAVLFFLFPHNLAGTAFIDLRFALMAPFVLAAAFRPELPPGATRLAAAALLLTTFARTGAVATTWVARQSDVLSMLQALQPVPPGATVLPLQHVPSSTASAPAGRYTGGMPVFAHLPALAVPWRNAFVPTLFAVRGKQPLQVLPPWSEWNEPDGGMLADVHVLDDPAVLAASIGLDRFLERWRHFDYALVLNADLPDRNGPLVPPPTLQLVRDEGYARLYRILHGP